MSRQLATVSIGPASGWSLEHPDFLHTLTEGLGTYVTPASAAALTELEQFERHLADLIYAADLGRATAERFAGRAVQETLDTFGAVEAGVGELLAVVENAGRDLARVVVPAEWVADVAAELVEPITENLTPWDLVLAGLGVSHRPRIAHRKAEYVARVRARTSPAGPARPQRCPHRPRGSPTSSPIAFGIPRHGPPTLLDQELRPRAGLPEQELAAV